MGKKIILAAGLSLALAATAMGQSATDGNYAFPAPWNPAGKAAKDVTQFVTITWDDNSYSGVARSGYESAPGQKFAQWSFVDGKNPDESAPATPGATTGWVEGRPNVLNILEEPGQQGNKSRNRMGVNWSHKAFPAEVKMTYFMLAGFFVNTFTDGTESAWDSPSGYSAWQNGESDLGWLSGDAIGQPYVAKEEGYVKSPVIWGREYRSQLGNVETTDKNKIPQRNTIFRAITEAKNKGHEIANHTLDHLETNSMLPGPNNPSFNSKGFGRWDNFGFSGQQVDVAAWGEEYDKTLLYGTTGKDLDRGWITYAGRQLNLDTWKGVIAIADEWLTQNKGEMKGGLGLGSGKVKGFRAPRLEYNSNMYYGLKELNYTYSSTLEEGFESHVNGENFLWPYTTNNGTRNSWHQTDIGARSYADSLPEGIWEIPLNVLIVPPHLRTAVFNNWVKLNDALGGKGSLNPLGDVKDPGEHWDGKITAFDFNLWVYYGMSGEQFQQTMRYTLDQRMTPGGNRAPFNYGAHTDYYTPIYDNATLLNDFNKNDYGLIVKEKTPGENGFGNDWKIRQEETEKFIDYALSKQAKFVTCSELIDSLRKMNIEGESALNDSVVITNDKFVLYRDGTQKADTTLADFTGTQTILAGPTAQGNQPKFVFEVDNDEYAKMTHISLEYKSRTAIAVRLIIEKDGKLQPTRQVILTHRYPKIGYDGKENSNYEAVTQLRKSGRIPLTSFDFDKYYTGVRNYSSIDPANIKQIEIVPLAPENRTPLYGEPEKYGDEGTRTDDEELKFEIANVKFYTGTPFVWDAGDQQKPTEVSIVKPGKAGRVKSTLSLAGITNNALKLNVTQAGLYNVKVFSANGRMLQSFDSQNLKIGLNTLKLNNFAAGIYMIKVQGINTKQQLTKSALVF